MGSISNYAELQANVRNVHSRISELIEQRLRLEAEIKFNRFRLDPAAQEKYIRDTGHAYKPVPLTPREVKHLREDLAEAEAELAALKPKIRELEPVARQLAQDYLQSIAPEASALWEARQQAEVLLLATQMRLEALLGPEWKAKQPHRTPTLPSVLGLAKPNPSIVRTPYGWEKAKNPDDLIDSAAYAEALAQAKREAEEAARAGAKRAKQRVLT